MAEILTAEQIAAMDPKERKAYRARVRRQAGRETSAEAIPCLLCEKQIAEKGKTEMGGSEPYKALSLITHIRNDHGILTGTLGYEAAVGIPAGTGKVVSPSLVAEKFAPAGAKGAAVLAEKRAAESGEEAPARSSRRRASAVADSE